ncbi:MAG: amidohydrolase family protein, partial [Deltaproteobacteria bacterium]|nr:amidohydrolase family protein [Deltaproteobacteria bacterium]
WVIDEPHVRGMRAVMDAWKIIDAGFTTIRDVGGMLAIYLKTAVNEGSIVGPRILASGLVVTQTAGHADWHFVPREWADRMLLGRVADGVAEVRKAAREQLREGADLLKIMTTGGVMSEKDSPSAVQYSMEEVRAFSEEARNAEVKTTTHCHGAQGIKNAILGGIDCIEHGTLMDDECVELMVKHGTHLVPTFAIVDAIVTNGRKMGVMEGSVRKAEAVTKHHMNSFLSAYKAGVTCGLGTDYLSDPMSPHGENAVELDIYVNKAGLTPMETIVCATKNNAIILNLEKDLGTLEAGKLADVLVVNGNPLDDITLLRDKTRITEIYKEGTPVPRLPK